MSDVSAITGNTTSASTDYTTRIPVQQQLNQKDFIQLLVAQLTTQDPLNPQKDTEFIGQMAQFSALQNSKDLETEMQTMRASQLLGQTVEVKLDDDSITKGVVSAVDSSSGDPKIVVGDHAYALNRVIRVDQTQTTTKAYAPPQIQTATKGYAPS